MRKALPVSLAIGFFLPVLMEVATGWLPPMGDGNPFFFPIWILIGVVCLPYTYVAFATPSILFTIFMVLVGLVTSALNQTRSFLLSLMMFSLGGGLVGMFIGQNLPILVNTGALKMIGAHLTKDMAYDPGRWHAEAIKVAVLSSWVLAAIWHRFLEADA